MISWMQKKQKYLIVTLWVSGISFIGAGFVGWGTYSFESNVVKEVGGEEITKEELSGLMDRLKSVQGGKNEEVLKGLAMDILIQTKRHKDYLKRQGFVVQDREVLSVMSGMKYFQNEKGLFDRDKYFELLKDRRISPKNFEEGLRGTLYTEYLRDFVKDVRVNEVEKKGISKMYTKSIDLEYVLNPVSEEGDVTREEALAYYEKNKEKYRKAKEYELEVVSLPPREYKASNEELETFHAANWQILGLDRDFEREDVYVAYQKEKGKKEAQLEYIKVKKGESSLKSSNMTVQDDGGFLEKGRLAKLKVGSYEKPILDSGIYYIVKLKGVRDNFQSFEDVSGKILGVMNLEKNKGKKLADLAKTFSKEVSGYTFDKKMEGVGYDSPLAEFGIHGAEVSELKRLMISKNKGEVGYFYSPDLKSIVVYRVSDVKSRELTPDEDFEITRNIKRIKSALYFESIEGKINKEYK